MKPILAIGLLYCGLSAFVVAQEIGAYQHGSVIRMHMGDCVLGQHGFMTAFGPPAAPMSGESCPEYTLLSKDVVYIIVGKSSNQLIPLAENIGFHLRKNELLVRVDDAKHEAKFTIKEMMVRPEWDRLQRHIEEALRTSEIHDASR